MTDYINLGMIKTVCVLYSIGHNLPGYSDFTPLVDSFTPTGGV